MKYILIFTMTLFLSLSSLAAEEFTKAATIKPELVQKGSQKEWCPVCGMKIGMFYKTSHASKIHDDKQRQYCSIRCLAVDMKEHDINLDDIKVVDVTSQKLIDANSAFYVVGSDVQGTMTKVSKLAFADKKAAEAFSDEHGGKIVDFKTTLKMAQDSLSSDIQMVQNNKEKKMYPMGKNIFEKKCKQNLDINAYLEINELKAGIKEKNLCGELQEPQLQALSLYLWEVKRFGDAKGGEYIHVAEDEKCPICGMFVYKYPKWAAQIFYGEKHYSFDGVKDMMNYYFDNKDGISKMLVSDYYSQKAIDATKAYYVIGSDVYGPMGHELIPFKNESEAKNFSMDHKGFKVLKFEEINLKEVQKLDD
ncbi:nitrous oxide reductase accessory protein NosL [Sulfurimonas sp.]|jgi:nitrous oxide reductase accessory protein NosL|uniref:nitrous oxide reductase accessory protein NosL n=1 Tax=Sulfurimonas sp. TaxID=2022749 RepID=UPI0025E84987|nr:nitrous oxide reductase accessory protein NosL [Sulfurimonas sp.]MCK9473121.1 nitrous oxide reductase accessory protein NosL [Sulfurimonas sp.]MDD3505957.1 nitrous oxide reductase accessory protein NosL [Sulfurimonas sp.]